MSTATKKQAAKEIYINMISRIRKERKMLIFEWKNGSLNDNGLRLLRENGIDYYYQWFHPYADFDRTGNLSQYSPVEYRHIEGDIWEIARKVPQC